MKGCNVRPWCTARNALLAVSLTVLCLCGIQAVAYAQPYCNQVIPPGWLTEGRIAYSRATCQFTFYGVAGDSVVIRMNASRGSALDPCLDLKHPSGDSFLSDDDGGGGRNSLIMGTLRNTGWHTIVARDYGSGSGAFTLELRQTIQPNQWYDGNISSPGLRYAYQFEARVRQRISITMEKTSNNLDPWLDLIDPAGAIVASDDDSGGQGNSYIGGFSLGRSGSHTIIARSYNDASSGPFRLKLSIN